MHLNGSATFGEPITPVGHCVALTQDDKVLAAARIADDWSATLNLPVTGDVYVSWTEPNPKDRACAAHAYAFVTVPGPREVTMEVGGVCY